MNWLRRLRHSIKLRLLAVFLLLALSVAFIFISGAQKAFSLGWREAARPLLMDYVSRLAADVAPSGTPEVQRAQAIVSRLPVITIDIAGPQVNWLSIQKPLVRADPASASVAKTAATGATIAIGTACSNAPPWMGTPSASA